MAETEVAEQKTNPLTWLEALSKATALILFVTYLSGFIIVSVHNASYGFTELSPFKPRILSAGVLFCSLVLVPIFSAYFVFSQIKDPDLKFPASLASALAKSTVFLVGCSFAATALTPIYVNSASTEVKTHSIWSTLPLSIVFSVFFTLLILFVYENRGKRPWPSIAASAIVLVAAISVSYIDGKTNPSGAVRNWFFGVGLASLLIRRRWRAKKFDLQSDIVFPMVVALSLFPNYLYPRIKYSWGGGEPTPIVLYFSGDTQLFPKQEIQGQLLDESDGGFYVLQHNQDKALYIPRNAVSAIYFSQSPIILESDKPKAQQEAPKQTVPEGATDMPKKSTEKGDTRVK